jgi:protein-disulfide isomerase
MIPHTSLNMPDARRDHFQGATEAPIALLEYGDYECPFCRDVQPVVKEIQQRLGDDLCLAFRHFPLTQMHPHAEHAAEAAEAAANQGRFWEMHETLFENQRALDDESLARYAFVLDLDGISLLKEVVAGAYASRIREDFRAGVRGGVNGTPCFFINGRRYDGARGIESLLSALSEASKQSVT